MSREEIYPKALRKVLIRMGSRKFFVDQSQESKFAQREGVTRFREPVHIVDRKPVLLNEHGRCEYCDVNPSPCNGKVFKHSGFDVPREHPLTPSAIPSADLGSADWKQRRVGPSYGMKGRHAAGTKQLRPFIPVPQLPSIAQVIIQAQIAPPTDSPQWQSSLAGLPEDIKKQIEERARQIFLKASIYRYGPYGEMALGGIGHMSPTETDDLRHAMYQKFDEPMLEPGTNPRDRQNAEALVASAKERTALVAPEIGEAGILAACAYYEHCKSSCDQAMNELDDFLKSVLPSHSKARSYICGAWREWADANLLMIRQGARIGMMHSFKL